MEDLDGSVGRRDATFFDTESGSGVLSGYARGVLVANVAWAGWRVLVLLVSWLVPLPRFSPILLPSPTRHSTQFSSVFCVVFVGWAYGSPPATAAQASAAPASTGKKKTLLLTAQHPPSTPKNPSTTRQPISPSPGPGKNAPSSGSKRPTTSASPPALPPGDSTRARSRRRCRSCRRRDMWARRAGSRGWSRFWLRLDLEVGIDNSSNSNNIRGGGGC